MGLLILVAYFSIYVGLVTTVFFALSYLYGEKRRVPLFKDRELPKVSIIIPACNEEKSTVKTLESILGVDYPKNKFEVIFVDDGSKDNTLKIARKFEGNHDGKVVKVFTKKNGGKASALNLGISHATGKIIFSMDADTYVEKDAVIKMTRYFKDDDVMCVAPAMVVSNPKGILQRIQYMEYMLGIFLRKSFASLNALSVTPGAFSAYRKEFFDKYGGYDVGNITEDLEVALRIQSNHFIIQNCPEAVAYTNTPNKFRDLLNQRKRWYVGLIKNSWNYRKLISKQYGDMGVFVMPVVWLSILVSIAMVVYFIVDSSQRIYREILFLKAINFNIFNFSSFNEFFLESFLFDLFTNPLFVFFMIFMVVIGFYLHYASKKVGKVKGLIISLPIYLIFFALLFGFWWVVSVIYVIFDRKVIWKEQ